MGVRRTEIGAERCGDVEKFVHAARMLEYELNRRLSEEADVTYAYYQILAALAHEQHRMQMTELAIAVGMSKSCLSHAVTRMQARQWVRREAGESGDARTIDAVLTNLGLAAYIMATPIYLRHVRELALDRLTPEQLDDLRDASQVLLPAADIAALGGETELRRAG